MNQWELVFKILANINRLKIIKILKDDKELDVGDIADKLKISFKATSQHLVILKNVGILKSVGREGHVYYSLNQALPKEFRQAIKLFA